MYVNPFWFGYLMGFLTVFALLIIASIVDTHRDREEDEDDERK